MPAECDVRAETLATLTAISEIGATDNPLILMLNPPPPLLILNIPATWYTVIYWCMILAGVGGLLGGGG